MQWFRLHNKLLNDPVVQRLSPVEFKVYINLLCHASIADDAGVVGTIGEVSFALRETIDSVSKCFIAFQKVGLIVPTVTDSETFQIPQWKKKQYKSDTSTERVKRHREKEKRSKTVTVTAPETETETETETEKDKKLPSTHKELKFNAWIKSLGEENPVPEDDPIFAWAADAGIPSEFLLLAWREFKLKNEGGTKKYIDWRRVFRNAVRNNWGKLWWVNNGSYELNTVGQQAMNVLRAEQKRGVA